MPADPLPPRCRIQARTAGPAGTCATTARRPGRAARANTRDKSPPLGKDEIEFSSRNRRRASPSEIPGRPKSGRGCLRPRSRTETPPTPARTFDHRHGPVDRDRAHDQLASIPLRHGQKRRLRRRHRKNSPTATGRLPSCSSLRVTLWMAAMWSASKTCRNPKVGQKSRSGQDGIGVEGRQRPQPRGQVGGEEPDIDAEYFGRLCRANR